MDDEQRSSDINSSRFEKTFNDHGYGFQYAVIQHIKGLRNKGDSHLFSFDVSEFPVDAKLNNTRVDFIFKKDTRPYIYLICECKRVNPALSDWWFVKAPFITEDNEPGYEIYFNSVFFKKENDGLTSCTAYRRHAERNLFNLGFEVKTAQTGLPISSGRGAIEESCSQVLRGLNGTFNFIDTHSLDFYEKHQNSLDENEKVIFIPVIFTTAQLYGSDIDLKNTNLENGQVDFTTSKFVRVPWLLYHYAQSENLKHSMRFDASDRKVYGVFSKALIVDYTKTIAIVNPSGIGDFLQWTSKIAYNWYY